MTRFATCPFTFRARAAFALQVAALRRRWAADRRLGLATFSRASCLAMAREWLGEAARNRRMAVIDGSELP